MLSVVGGLKSRNRAKKPDPASSLPSSPCRNSSVDTPEMDTNGWRSILLPRVRVTSSKYAGTSYSSVRCCLNPLLCTVSSVANHAPNSESSYTPPPVSSILSMQASRLALLGSTLRIDLYLSSSFSDSISSSSPSCIPLLRSESMRDSMSLTS